MSVQKIWWFVEWADSSFIEQESTAKQKPRMWCGKWYCTTNKTAYFVVNDRFYLITMFNLYKQSIDTLHKSGYG